VPSAGDVVDAPADPESEFHARRFLLHAASPEASWPVAEVVVADGVGVEAAVVLVFVALGVVVGTVVSPE
jgi:hypothetical protein